MKQSIKNRLSQIAAGAALAGVSGVAFATGTGPDLTPLTGQVDFGTTITAVLAIGVVIATLLVAIRGAKTVLRMIMH